MRQTPPFAGLRSLLLVAWLVWAVGAKAEEPARDEVIYFARSGDTLIGLAKRMLVPPGDWRKLQALNDIRESRRIPVGSALRIPVAWLRAEPQAASVLAVQGEAVRDGVRLEPGATLTQGARVSTGPDGFVTILLADGSTLILQPSSRLALARLARYPGPDVRDTRMELDTGRVDTSARRQRPADRFEIRSLVAITAVRGTEFRTGYEGAQSAHRTEVLEGAADMAGGGREVLLDSGFGSVSDATGAPSPPKRLLPPPDLGNQPPLAERVVFRFRFNPVAGAAGYRGQVAADREFHRVVADAVFPGPEIKFAELPDGPYWLRARSIDSSGLEGDNAYHRFELKARPEPPFPQSPSPGGKQSGARAEFGWTAAADAALYRLQLARDSAFKDLVAEQSAMAATRAIVENVSPGAYHWRLASERANGERGPWGDAQAYTQKPAPANPEPPAIDKNHVSFAWSGEPGQRFRVQLARDTRFDYTIAEFTSDEPMMTLPKPDPGVYFVRVQATDPDGYVGPYTAAQRFEILPVPPSPWLLLLLLVPLL